MLNVGSDSEISKHLAEKISDIVGFKGEIFGIKTNQMVLKKKIRLTQEYLNLAGNLGQNLMKEYEKLSKLMIIKLQ